MVVRHLQLADVEAMINREHARVAVDLSEKPGWAIYIYICLFVY